MEYEIGIDVVAHDGIATLPSRALLPLAEALTLLRISPWSARPINENNPDGPVRILEFGAAGMLTALISKTSESRCRCCHRRRATARPGS